MVLGAQLYTVRDYTQNERDLAVTLEAVAKMGYTTVQVSAIGPIPPARVRALCDANGLRIVLTHVPPERILNETEAVIAEHDILGCDHIGLGAMPAKYRTAEWIGRFADDYLPPARKIAAAGKRFMYHNHDFDFMRAGGKLLLEHLLDAFAPEEMGVTLDTYWVQAAGCDVYDWIERLQDRIPCVHLKDMAMAGADLDSRQMAPVLEGNMNFAKILALLEKLGKTEYLLVEQDFCPAGPFTSLKQSYDNLAGLGYR